MAERVRQCRSRHMNTGLSMLVYFLPNLMLFFLLFIIFTSFIRFVLIRDLRTQYRKNIAQTVQQSMRSSTESLGQLQRISEYLMQDTDVRVKRNLEDVVEAKRLIRNLSKYTVVNSGIREIAVHFINDEYVYTGSTTMKWRAFQARVLRGAESEHLRAFQGFAEDGQTRTRNFYPLYGLNHENAMLARYPMEWQNGQVMLYFVVDLIPGEILSTSYPLLILDKDNQLLASTNAQIADKIDKLRPMVSTLVQTAEPKEHRFDLGAEGEAYLLSVAEADETNWRYVVLTPENDVYASLNDIEKLYIIILLLIGLSGLLFIIIGLRYGFSPLWQLIHFARQFKRQACEREEKHGISLNKGLGEVRMVLDTLARENSALQSSVAQTRQMDLLGEILNGDLSQERFREVIKAIGASFNADKCFFIYLLTFNDARRDEARTKRIFDLLDEVLPVFVVYPLGMGVRFLVMAQMHEDLSIERTAGQLHVSMSDSGVSCSLCYGEATGSKAIRACVARLLEAETYRFVYGATARIDCDQLEKTMARQAGEAFPEQLFTGLHCALVEGAEEKSLRVLQQIREALFSGRYSLTYVKGLCFRLWETLWDPTAVWTQNIDEDRQRSFRMFDTAQTLFEACDQQVRMICREVRRSRYKRHDRLLLNMKTYIEAHCQDQMFTVRELADHFNMTMSGISQYFKNYAGETISQYMTRLRMDRAKALLCEKRLTVKEAAEAVGYQNTSSFIRKFKSLYGMTPIQYVEQTFGGESDV